MRCESLAIERLGCRNSVSGGSGSRTEAHLVVRPFHEELLYVDGMLYVRVGVHLKAAWRSGIIPWSARGNASLPVRVRARENPKRPSSQRDGA